VLNGFGTGGLLLGNDAKSDASVWVLVSSPPPPIVTATPPATHTPQQGVILSADNSGSNSSSAVSSNVNPSQYDYNVNDDGEDEALNPLLGR